MGEREPEQPIRRLSLSTAQIQALIALSESGTTIIRGGEHHKVWTLEVTYNVLVSQGFASSSARGVYCITGAGREEAKHWPRR